MQDVTAAGGVVFRINGDAVEVLLIRRNGVWDLPKGKLEEGESIPACAVREVAEELGIDTPSIVRSLGQTAHSYEMNNAWYAKTTYWYLMLSLAEQFQPQTEEQIEAVEWVELQEAQARVGYENLRTVLLRAEVALTSE